MQKPSFDTILENVCVIMPTAAYILLTAGVTRLAGALGGADQRPRTKSAPLAPRPRRPRPRMGVTIPGHPPDLSEDWAGMLENLVPAPRATRVQYPARAALARICAPREHAYARRAGTQCGTQRRAAGS